MSTKLEEMEEVLDQLWGCHAELHEFLLGFQGDDADMAALGSGVDLQDAAKSLRTAITDLWREA